MTFKNLAHALTKLENTAAGNPQQPTAEEAAELLEYVKFHANGGRWLVNVTYENTTSFKRAEATP